MREFKFRMFDKTTKEMELLDSLYEFQKMNLNKEELNNKIIKLYYNTLD